MMRGMSVIGAATVSAFVLAGGWSASPLVATNRSDAVDLAANVIGVPYVWFGDLSGMETHRTLAAQLNGMFCQADGGDECSLVNYPRWDTPESIAIGVADLLSRITATTGPGIVKTIVQAYSLGGTVVEQWLQRYGHGGAGLPGANDLSFVMTGRPNATGSTPTLLTVETIYKVLDVVRQYDGVANRPDDPTNFWAGLNAIAGFFLVHTDYANVDLFDPANTVYKVGNVTYVFVPTRTLPLLAGLEPLRLIGLGGIVDALNDVLKPLVDAGYNGGLPKGAVMTTVAAEFPELVPRSVSASLAASPSVQRASIEVGTSVATNDDKATTETSTEQSSSQATSEGDDQVPQNVEEPSKQPVETDVEVRQDQSQPAAVDETQTVTQVVSSDEEQPADSHPADDVQTDDHDKSTDTQDESGGLKSAVSKGDGQDTSDDANKPSPMASPVSSPGGASPSGSTESNGSPDSAQ